jgi:hypothetical protein
MPYDKTTRTKGIKEGSSSTCYKSFYKVELYTSDLGFHLYTGLQFVMVCFYFQEKHLDHLLYLYTLSAFNGMCTNSEYTAKQMSVLNSLRLRNQKERYGEVGVVLGNRN